MDRISFLYDDVLQRILTFLPTEDAVRTTLLSKKWSNLWTKAPFHHLDFDDIRMFQSPHGCPDEFVHFVDKVLRLGSLSKVRSFRLSCARNYGFWHLNAWLNALCTPKIVEVDINIDFDDDFVPLPRVLYTSTSLEVMKLKATIELDIADVRFCFPNLKVLHVYICDLHDIDFTGRLYSRCPALQDLTIDGFMDDAKVNFDITISSVTLKRLKIDFELMDTMFEDDHVRCSFVVHAENLEFLSLSDEVLARYALDNMHALHRAEIMVGNERMRPRDWGLHPVFDDHVFDFLGGLSCVESLYLSGKTVGALTSFIRRQNNGNNDGDDEDDCHDDFDNSEVCAVDSGLPEFSCLKSLKLGFLDCCSRDILRHVLRNSPNLEYLVLKKENLQEIDNGGEDDCGRPWERPEKVPECMLLNIKSIELEGFRGNDYPLELVEYLLRNAEVLQRMTISDRAEGHEHHIIISQGFSSLPNRFYHELVLRKLIFSVQC